VLVSRPRWIIAGGGRSVAGAFESCSSKSRRTMGYVLQHMARRKAEISIQNHHGEKMSHRAIIPTVDCSVSKQTVNQRAVKASSASSHEYGTDRGESRQARMVP